MSVCWRRESIDRFCGLKKLSALISSPLALLRERAEDVLDTTAKETNGKKGQRRRTFEASKKKPMERKLNRKKGKRLEESFFFGLSGTSHFSFRFCSEDPVLTCSEALTSFRVLPSLLITLVYFDLGSKTA